MLYDEQEFFIKIAGALEQTDAGESEWPTPEEPTSKPEPFKYQGETAPTEVWSGESTWPKETKVPEQKPDYDKDLWDMIAKNPMSVIMGLELKPETDPNVVYGVLSSLSDHVKAEGYEISDIKPESQLFARVSEMIEWLNKWLDQKETTEATNG